MTDSQDRSRRVSAWWSCANPDVDKVLYGGWRIRGGVSVIPHYPQMIQPPLFNIT